MTNQLAEIVTDILQCSVCLERLKTPKRLPCGHVFCQRCVERLNSRNCPTCRSTFSRTAELPTDLVVGKLLEAPGHRHPCSNCTSTFAGQCSHCKSQLCHSCMLLHLRASLSEKRQIIKKNVPEGTKTWVEIGDKVRQKMDESIESARQKAMTHINAHYDNIKEIWRVRLEDLADDYDDQTLKTISLQKTELEEKLNTSLETQKKFSELLVHHKELDQVLENIEELQAEMDETFDELVAMQWNLSDKTRGSQGRLKNCLRERRVATKATVEARTDQTAMSNDETASEDEPEEEFVENKDAETVGLKSTGLDAGISVATTVRSLFGGFATAPVSGGGTFDTSAPVSVGFAAATVSGGFSFAGKPVTAPVSVGLAAATVSGGFSFACKPVTAPVSGGLFGQSTESMFCKTQSTSIFGQTSRTTSFAGTVSQTTPPVFGGQRETEASEDVGKPAGMPMPKQRPKKNIVGDKSDNLSFEERRVPYWEKTKARVKRNAGDGVRPPCIRLHTHRTTGLLTTPTLTFWVETAGNKGQPEPTSFPGKPLQPGDEDESSPFFTEVEDETERTDLTSSELSERNDSDDEQTKAVNDEESPSRHNIDSQVVQQEASE